jgi:tryptophan synthase alpha chain
MPDRYHEAFARLSGRGEGAFIPFTVLGDPDPETSLEILRALVRGGADMLELGLPFSDPIADGPTIQAADVRALESGTRVADAWHITQTIRQEHPELPMGLLVYANLVETHGAAAFYRGAHQAGVDSVLVADVPSLEAEPYARAAGEAGILPVLIATPNDSDEHRRQIASLSRGYTYVVTRAGVTGADDEAQLDHRQLLGALRELGAPPPVLGFGISRPEHVRAALDAGAAGAISGSAVVKRIETHLNDRAALLEALESFVREMKAATHNAPAEN